MDIHITDSYKRDAASWVSFLKDFKSRASYMKAVDEFAAFHTAKSHSSSEDHYSIDCLNATIIEYFDHLHDLPHPKKEEQKKFCSTTLRSEYAKLKKFFLHTGRGDLDTTVPIITSNINKWDKAHTVTKAKVLTKEQLSKFVIVIKHLYVLFFLFLFLLNFL